MPAGIDDVASQALEGLAAAVSSGQKRLKVDIFVPGLNPKLEGSAPYNAGLLLAFVKSLLPALDACANIKLLFSSAGDAAMAQKTFGDMGWRLPEGTRFASLSPGSVTAEDGAIVIVNPRNSVGDPVILDVEKVALKAPQATIVLVNPDLGEKVALGIIERDRRSALLASFKQAYYFRNLFYMRRPDMVPVERGGLVCQWGRGWSVYVTDPSAENMGPGSLNRFMTVPVYRRRGEDPTAKNPPTFFLVEQFQDEPTRDQISACVDNSGSVADKAREAEEARLAALVESPAQAREIAAYAAFDGRVTPTQKLLNAVAVLEADDRRTRKARRTALDEGGRQVNFEELTRGQGLWRLTFLVKEGKKAKGSGSATEGSVTYVPIKAVQQFSADGTICNGVYAWSFPLVKFSGKFKWSEASSRMTFGFDECKILGFNVPVAQPQSKVVPGFTMFAVEGGEKGFIMGRGNTGGIALWRRIESTDAN